MNIMDEVTHRPWPIVSKNWIIRQSWSNLLFTHWPISVDLLRPHIPSSLKIDTFEGTAWLGVVVFIMEGIYLRGLPALSLTPKFAETWEEEYRRSGATDQMGEKTEVADLSEAESEQPVEEKKDPRIKKLSPAAAKRVTRKTSPPRTSKRTKTSASKAKKS
jgi:hypothetical protein